MSGFVRERKNIAYALVLAVVGLSFYLAITRQISAPAVSLIALLCVAGLNAVGVPMDPRKRGNDGLPVDDDDDVPQAGVAGDRHTRPMGPIQGVEEVPSDGDARVLVLPRHHRPAVRWRDRHRRGYHGFRPA